MIGKKLQALLDEKRMNVNELARTTGVSNQTLYSIIKRNNMKIDFEVLLKICSALDVSVECFYSDYITSTQKESSPGAETPEERIDRRAGTFYQLLTEGGYIRPGEGLTPEQTEAVKAILTLMDVLLNGSGK